MNKAVWLVLACGVPWLASAADGEISISIKDHRFTPAEVRVPAGQKGKLIVSNLGAAPGGI